MIKIGEILYGIGGTESFVFRNVPFEIALMVIAILIVIIIYLSIRLHRIKKK